MAYSKRDKWYHNVYDDSKSSERSRRKQGVPNQVNQAEQAYTSKRSGGIPKTLTFLLLFVAFSGFAQKKGTKGHPDPNSYDSSLVAPPVSTQMKELILHGQPHDNIQGQKSPQEHQPTTFGQNGGKDSTENGDTAGTTNNPALNTQIYYNSTKQAPANTKNGSGKPPLQDTIMATGELASFLSDMLQKIVKAENRDEQQGPAMAVWNQNAKNSGLDASGEPAMKKNLKKALDKAAAQGVNKHIIYYEKGISKVVVLDMENQVGGIFSATVAGNNAVISNTIPAAIAYPANYDKGAATQMLINVYNNHLNVLNGQGVGNTGPEENRPSLPSNQPQGGIVQTNKTNDKDNSAPTMISHTRDSVFIISDDKTYKKLGPGDYPPTHYNEQGWVWVMTKCSEYLDSIQRKIPVGDYKIEISFIASQDDPTSIYTTIKNAKIEKDPGYGLDKLGLICIDALNRNIMHYMSGNKNGHPFPSKVYVGLLLHYNPNY